MPKKATAPSERQSRSPRSGLDRHSEYLARRSLAFALATSKGPGKSLSYGQSGTRPRE